MAYANSADQNVPEGVIWCTLFAIPLNILRNDCIKSIIYEKKNKNKQTNKKKKKQKNIWNKVFEILGHLTYSGGGVPLGGLVQYFLLNAP